MHAPCVLYGAGSIRVRALPLQVTQESGFYRTTADLIFGLNIV